MNSFRNTTLSALTVAMMCLVAFVGSIYVASPAKAEELPPLQRAAELNAPYQNCGTVTCTVYLDRSTSKYYADRLDAAGLGGENAVDTLRGLACSAFPKGIGFICGLADSLVGSSFLEAVQHAEEIDGCVTFKYVSSPTTTLPIEIGATNSKYCRD